MKKLISELYGKKLSKEICKKIDKIINKYKNKSILVKQRQPISENDVALICYADNIYLENRPTLQIMNIFFEKYLSNLISYIHFLPFYPYSSDDGFAVQDFFTIKSDYGDWTDIQKTGKIFNLIFDAVINHISSKHEWFQEYLKSNPKYENYFIKTDKNTDISKVMRARDLPLLSKFQKDDDEIFVWTTFSNDQIDLNYKSYEILLVIIDVLLFYAVNGASIIRLDAIAYIWKNENSNCINLEETHKIIMIIRKVFDNVFPHVMLLPEANVPSKENIQYLGNGKNEAQLIYQFCFSTLVLYTFYSQNVIRLLEYLKNIPQLSENNYFFNVLATHDGIGLRPVLDILNENEINLILNEMKKRKVEISYKSEKNGKKTPYEMNVTYFDALNDINDSIENNIKKFIAAHAILLSIQGFPALYFHSLFGTRNYTEGFKKTGHPRTLNRRKFEYHELEGLLNNPESHESQIFKSISNLLQIRKTSTAFHPKSNQKVLNLSKNIFSIVREKEDKILVLVNISNKSEIVKIPNNFKSKKIKNLIDKQKFQKIMEIRLKPFEIMWLQNY